LADWREEEALVVIAAPRFKGRLGKGLVEVLGKDQTYNLRLDGFGSFVWRLIDGERTLGEIADATIEHIDAEEETALHRLLMFLRSLQNMGAVKVVIFENPEGDI
ncbi:MAG: PqqD family protein, partial [Thermoplasmata archaeon]|nr:PqqD family protein [Thermoplasmata archaeon]